MVERMRLEGRTAIITGAASGIGRAIAVSLARRRCNLALADVDEVGMSGTEDSFEPTVRVTRHLLDVGTAPTSLAFQNKLSLSIPAWICWSTTRA